jgi:hypothetical protein
MTGRRHSNSKFSITPLSGALDFANLARGLAGSGLNQAGISEIG